MLRNAEYAPFVVFIGAPDLHGLLDPDGSLERLVKESELLRQSFGHLFDFVLINNGIDETILERSPELNEEERKYALDYCTSKNMYYVAPEKGIPWANPERRARQLGYYHWVPIMLFLQAILFYLPNWLWNHLNQQSGIEFTKFIEEATKLKDMLLAPIEERQEQINQLGEKLSEAVLNGDPYRRIVGCLFGQSMGAYVSLLYVCIKVLYLGNVAIGHPFDCVLINNGIDETILEVTHSAGSGNNTKVGKVKTYEQGDWSKNLNKMINVHQLPFSGQNQAFMGKTLWDWIKKPRARFSDSIDRLNCHFVPFGFGGMEPMRCLRSPELNEEERKYALDYCTSKNMYYVAPEKGIPWANPERRARQLGYYHWVPIMLFLQAILFYLPNWLWNHLNQQSGIEFTKFIEEATKLKDMLLAPIEERQEQINQLGEKLSEAVLNGDPYRRIVGCLFGQSMGAYVSGLLYVCIKVLYLGNVAIGHPFDCVLINNGIDETILEVTHSAGSGNNTKVGKVKTYEQGDWSKNLNKMINVHQLPFSGQNQAFMGKTLWDWIKKPRARFSDSIDRLNCHFVPFGFGGMEPMRCLRSPELNEEERKYALDYCTSKNMYYVAPEKGIPWANPERRARQLGYYHWVPIMLFLQAILFYLPNWLWNHLNQQSGIEFTKFIEEATKLKDMLLAPIEERQEQINQLGEKLSEAVLNGDPYRRIVGCLFGQSMGAYVSLLYVCIKVLYLGNVAIGHPFDCVLINNGIDETILEVTHSAGSGNNTKVGKVKTYEQGDWSKNLNKMINVHQLPFSGQNQAFMGKTLWDWIKKPRARFSDSIDRLNCHFVPFGFGGMEPMRCLRSPELNEEERKYALDYCTSKNMYYVAPEKGIPWANPERRARQLGYYHWVPIMLFLQAILFYLPNWLWNHLNQQSGIEFTKFIEEATKLKDMLLAPIEERQEQINQLGEKLSEAVLNGDPYRRIVGCLFGQSMGAYVSLLYVCIKVLYLGNVAIGHPFDCVLINNGIDETILEVTHSAGHLVVAIHLSYFKAFA
ncbi:hypothetical protein niasHT_014934 [Heterodera trifolii]|uniref:Innexin n=1 Tax=Heterodera trifolii TaxID=157864 RepID=A0ABD2LFR7_9BILA